MAATLILIFFALLLFSPRLAFVALALAIVVLYRGRTRSALRTVRREAGNDSSI